MIYLVGCSWNGTVGDDPIRKVEVQQSFVLLCTIGESESKTSVAAFCVANDRWSLWIQPKLAFNDVVGCSGNGIVDDCPNCNVNGPTTCFGRLQSTMGVSESSMGVATFELAPIAMFELKHRCCDVWVGLALWIVMYSAAIGTGSLATAQIVSRKGRTKSNQIQSVVAAEYVGSFE